MWICSSLWEEYWQVGRYKHKHGAPIQTQQLEYITSPELHARGKALLLISVPNV